MARLQQPHRNGQQHVQKKSKNFHKKTLKKEASSKRRGPRLPFSLRKELHVENRRRPHGDGEGNEEEEEEVSQLPTSALPSDVYEYEENQAPEDSHKNRRFDDVDRFEYELPSDFEDEEIDEGAADGEDPGSRGKGPKGRALQIDEDDSDGDISSVSDDLDMLEHGDRDEGNEEVSSEIDGLDTFKHGLPDKTTNDENDEDSSDNEREQLQDEDGTEAEDASDTDANDGEGGDERHQKMIEAVCMPRKREPKERRPKRIELLSEAYPESEFNINPAADAYNLQQITVEDLMAPLQSTTGFGSLRKRMQQLEKKGVPVDAPLPKPVQQRLSRKAGYEKTSEEISKWQDIVKKNREAASLVFTQRPDLTATSTAELVSKFEPVTNLEKEVASLLQENGLVEDTSETATTLGFNKLTMDEVKERQERLAKMRTMLSYHEAKSKRMKKIKSKTYHRLLQKDRKGKAVQEDELDPESLKEAAVKAEFKRVQERMTLKHKNTSKWAKRIIKRGLKATEDGSREALAEQLRTHSALTRKIQSTDNTGLSDDSSDEMDTDSCSDDEKSGPSLPTKAKSKLLAKAKVETLKVLEGDAEAEIPTTGLFSLPFMARAIEKKRKQAQSEAIAVLEQLEQLEYNNSTEDLGFEVEREAVTKGSAGRLAFGDMARSISNEEPDMLVEDGSSSDEDLYEEDRGIPAAGKTPVNPMKRKAESSENLKVRKRLEKRGDKLRVTEEAWTDGDLHKAAALTVSTEQGHDLHYKVDVPLEISEARGTNVMAHNPWLYGASSENGTLGENGSITKKGAGVGRTGMKQDNPGPLITTASLEVVNIAGGKKKVDKEMKMPQICVISDTIIEENGEQVTLSSSTSEEEDDEGLKEPGFRLSSENASQAELIQRAFAGDDVEADFEHMKSEALNEEVPLGEAALNLPGWGQWTDVQKKRGPPLWMVKQQEELERKREQALNKRKDSKLKHVIISERMDKKAEKFVAPTLPFPFKSRDVFERSNRMPLGREFNSDQAFRDMIRPAVVKDAGVIIAPIEYKMSEAKAGDSNSPLEDKKGSQKRAKVSMAGAKRKSDKRSNGFVSEDKKDNKRANGFKAKRKH
ncbi:hypothetical protein GOP47_0014444 [Adiantum capillus-veneris]|uniref:Uncharacterized protein n=1 Tax=Adiantum capillus-veneris TaxID=13818 RepID=A0A9D4ULL2_ADICA|nr:hypothetical protein GOP47_0014444 [Adiantum capillus-veneris]